MCIRDRITPNVGYTPESWANFQNALTYANTGLGNEEATQKDVDRALGTLNAAFAPVSYTHLDVYKRQVQMMTRETLAAP